MSTNYLFKSIKIEKFRVFQDVNLDGLKRINIISGRNGSGKSALIETLFLILDLNNPLCLLKPFLWRGIPIGGDELKTLFPHENKHGTIEVMTGQGKFISEISYGPPTDDIMTTASKSLDPSARPAVIQLSSSNLQGANIKFRKVGDNSATSHWYTTQMGDAVNSTCVSAGNTLNVPGVYLSQFMPAAPQETADRASKLMKDGKKSDVLNYLKNFDNTVEDIQIFQDGQIAQTYVQKSDKKFTPLALMGGGLRAFFEILTAAMTSRNGVLFIDELDSALHFTAIPKLWKLLSEIADSQNI
ncbi:MAG: AAA family ATPase [Paracoccaceae bacterium]